MVAALFFIGDSNPQLRQALENMLQEIITGEPAREQHAGSVRVLDGDTLDMDGTRIRMFGIDAPESKQTCRRNRRDWACGEEATEALAKVIGRQSVRCEERDIDRYQRVVAECWAGGRNLNAWMVEQGWAVAYREYGGAIYDAQEASAKAAKRGVWNGRFVMPWDWRRGER